jgi:hypothetical protein
MIIRRRKAKKLFAAPFCGENKRLIFSPSEDLSDTPPDRAKGSLLRPQTK